MRMSQFAYIAKISKIFVFLFLLSIVSVQNIYSQKKIVVLDAGHGGKDPGAMKQGLNEKDITLPIALKVGKYLSQNMSNVKVIYTRTTDQFVELSKRAQIANDNKADLFISIHVNSTGSSKVQGATTYVMGLHKSQDNLEVAMVENSSILYEKDYLKTYQGFDPKSSEAYIIFNLYQNAYLDMSLKLAEDIQKQFRDKAKRIDLGVKQAGFLVLWQTTMPSVLIEVGFLSNKNEATYLNSEYGQDLIASGIYRAIKQYLLTN